MAVGRVVFVADPVTRWQTVLDRTVRTVAASAGTREGAVGGFLGASRKFWLLPVEVVGCVREVRTLGSQGPRLPRTAVG